MMLEKEHMGFQTQLLRKPLREEARELLTNKNNNFNLQFNRKRKDLRKLEMKPRIQDKNLFLLSIKTTPLQLV